MHKMKITIGIFLFTTFLFMTLGLPNLKLSLGIVKEYKMMVQETKKLRTDKQQIFQKKSGILNALNAAGGLNYADPVSVTNAIAGIKTITISKIVAIKREGEEEHTIATLYRAEDVGKLSKDLDILEYSLQTAPEQMVGTVMALEALHLDFEKIMLLAPNGNLSIRVRMFGGDTA